MNLKECMNVLQKDIHSVVVSMIDEKGHPVSAYLDVMHADETGVRNIGKERIDALINENPYMKNLYPDHNLERRKIIDVFHVYEGSGTYQEFSIDRPVCETISFTPSKQS